MFEQENTIDIENTFDVDAFLDTYYKEKEEDEEFVEYFIN